MGVLPIRPPGSGKTRLEGEAIATPFLRPAWGCSPGSGLLGTELGLLRRGSALVNMAGGSVNKDETKGAIAGHDAIAPDLRKRVPSGCAAARPPVHRRPGDPTRPAIGRGERLRLPSPDPRYLPRVQAAAGTA